MIAPLEIHKDFWIIALLDNWGIGNMVNVKIVTFNWSSFFIVFCSFLQAG